jgi:SAM-dependent methyltransferase
MRKKGEASMIEAKKIRESVAESYARAVDRDPGAGSSCCSGPATKGVAAALAGYSREALAGLPADAVVNSFGCGNPVALGEIREGDTVLDLGSGAGIDLLLAAKLTGPSGRVIGVDMTPAMIERARANAAAAGLDNVDVRRGIIEELPVESGTIDLVISNCVINLSPEKSRVFAEIGRVLRPGGRLSISDIVAEPMPDWVLASSELYASCIAGAVPEAEYLAGLRAAGLTDVEVRDRLVYDGPQLEALVDSEAEPSCGCCCQAPAGDLTRRVATALAGKVASVRVVGRKPE